MYHQHFNSIPSTQIYLKENLEVLKIQDNDILISCSEQTLGIGQRGNTWDSYPNSLAMSFTLKPNDIPTLTPLEIGLLTIKFLKKKFNKELFIKWPNDLLSIDGKKCGGILCQFIDSTTVIVGLGINVGKLKTSLTNDYRHGISSVDSSLEMSTSDQEAVSKEIYRFISMNRFLNKSELETCFDKKCAHLNKNISISEDGVDHLGIFRGIGANGEALVEINSTIKSFLSSSLTIIN